MKTKRILIAMDSFKGTHTSRQAADRVEAAVLAVSDGFSFEKISLADGGEGTTDAFLETLGGERISLTVSDPLGRPIVAEYGILPDGTAVVETAAAAGLTLLSDGERDPRITTTYGVGEMVRHAVVERGCRRVILGLGGSATNDGGAGFAEALGVRFLDDGGKPLPRGGAALARLAHIDLTGREPQLAETELIAACDVDNPICGERGATYVFGRQKGADSAMRDELEEALKRYAAVLSETVGYDAFAIAGGGAAGGLGLAVQVLTGGIFRQGIELLAETLSLKERIARADLVITGEGKTDSQTCQGKLPIGVARLCREMGKPCMLISGALVGDPTPLYEAGITEAHETRRPGMTLEEELATSAACLTACAARVIPSYFSKNT